MSETKYLSKPLFGGGIVCDLPKNFVDVSDLRQVPDHQEVYIDQNGFTNIVFEICERVGPSGNSAEIDGAALAVHLQELAGDDDETRMWNVVDTKFSELPEGIPAYTLIATQAPKTDSEAPATGEPDFTAIILTIVRLEKELTDFLITISVPHIAGEYDEGEIDLEMGKQGLLIGQAVEYAGRIWSTLTIKNWNLFKEV